MNCAYKSVYYSDGKIFDSKKKNGVENTFDHIKIYYLELENEIDEITSYLEKTGFKETGSRDAYDSIYKYFSKKRDQYGS